MLKRIAKIQNIGRFRRAACGNVTFNKLTLIFGRNTYGKSTLVDLLSSITLGDTSILKARRTVPDDGMPQEATVSFQINGKSNEKSLSIINNSWQSQLPEPLKLRVFDEGFYHKNVFVAQKFTRSTKENFSSFVLGAQGVAKAQEIAAKNKNKRAIATEKNKLFSAVFKEIEKIDEFLKLTPSSSVEELREKLNEKRKRYDTLNKQRKNSTIILKRKEFVNLEWKGSFIDSLFEINSCFQSSLETHHNTAREKLDEHIKKNFKNTHNAELWIRQGVKQNLGEKCQFCGQELGPDALGLLEIYQQSFDDSFEKHDKVVKQTLARCRASIFKNYTNELRVAVERNETAIISYPELEENSRYVELKKEISDLVNILKQLFDDWEKELSKFQENVDRAIGKKIEFPLVGLEKIQSEALLKISKNLLNKIKGINLKGENLNIIIGDYKKSIQNDKISELLNQISEEGKTLARNVKRFELSEQCDTYNLLTADHQTLSKQIPILQEQLQSEQSEFLGKYFERLNLHFKEFGSNDFKLNVGKDNSGHTPIYYLKVQFRDIDIAEPDLDRVFSESDRRALSLAVFWARLSGITVEEKRNTIVVLDDPVTSFDNNRISSVHRKIAILSDEVCQIIVLSHYEQEISKFLSTYRNSRNICFLSIDSTNSESTLSVESIDDFIMNDHEKARESLFNFVIGNNNSHSSGDLRIFLEIEIGLRFAKQIKDFRINETNLSDKIDKLLEFSVINENTARKCHMWRESLNPAHHIWTDDNIEDQRSTAGEFMEFVYNNLIPVHVE